MRQNNYFTPYLTRPCLQVEYSLLCFWIVWIEFDLAHKRLFALVIRSHRRLSKVLGRLVLLWCRLLQLHHLLVLVHLPSLRL